MVDPESAELATAAAEAIEPHPAHAKPAVEPSPAPDPAPIASRSSQGRISPELDPDPEPAPHDNGPDPDPDPSLDDEAYSSDAASGISTSLSSSVRDYAFENNRRYHKFAEGRYAFPNDDAEQDREDMKHAMVVNLCGGRLHYAPLQNPQKVLDVGTRTGIWAMDTWGMAVADEYPGAGVLGLDLSPIQPGWVPPNVRFIVDDAEAPWLHKPGTFDFVHVRHMTSSIRDWPKLISQAYTALKPGGWLELQELHFQIFSDDDTLKPDDPVLGLLENVRRGLDALGVDLLAMQDNPGRLRAGGFANVEERRFKVPIGPWPKDRNMKMVGEYNRSMIYDGLQAISLGPFTRGLGWTPEEVEVYLVGVRRGLMNRSVHSWYGFHVAYGQKPLDG